MGEQTKRDVIGASYIKGYELPDELGRAGLMAWSMGINDGAQPGKDLTTPKSNVRAILGNSQAEGTRESVQSLEYTRYEASISTASDYRIASNFRGLQVATPQPSTPNVIANPQPRGKGRTLRSVEYTRYESSGSGAGNYNIATNARDVRIPTFDINARSTGGALWPGDIGSQVRSQGYTRFDASCKNVKNFANGISPRKVEITTPVVNAWNTGATPRIGPKGKPIPSLENTRYEAGTSGNANNGNTPNPIPVKIKTPEVKATSTGSEPWTGGQLGLVWSPGHKQHQASSSSRDYGQAPRPRELEKTVPDINPRYTGATPRTGAYGKEFPRLEYKSSDPSTFGIGNDGIAPSPHAVELGIPNISTNNTGASVQPGGAGNVACSPGYTRYKSGTSSIADGPIVERDLRAAGSAIPKTNVVQDPGYPPPVGTGRLVQNPAEPQAQNGTSGSHHLASIFTQSVFQIPEGASHTPGFLNHPQPQFDDLLLFYIAYTYFNDRNKAASFLELHLRGWRRHKVHDYWMRQIKGMRYHTTDIGENGTYLVYGMKQWRLEKLWLAVDYSQLD